MKFDDSNINSPWIIPAHQTSEQSSASQFVLAARAGCGGSHCYPASQNIWQYWRIISKLNLHILFKANFPSIVAPCEFRLGNCEDQPAELRPAVCPVRLLQAACRAESSALCFSWNISSLPAACWGGPGRTEDSSPGSRPSPPSLSGCSWDTAAVGRWNMPSVQSLLARRDLSPLLVPEHVVGHGHAVVHSGQRAGVPLAREAARPAELVNSTTQTGDGQKYGPACRQYRNIGDEN